MLQILAAIASDPYESHMQELAWSNLPILNEWKRRYPDHDPVQLQEQFWDVKLVCPGGGQYVWNDKWQTMESTVYGSPAVPRKGPAIPPLLKTIQHGDFGVTFEEQGLRARVVLER